MRTICRFFGLLLLFAGFIATSSLFASDGMNTTRGDKSVGKKPAKDEISISSLKQKRILAKMKRDIIIMVDPGHGGDDFGGYSVTKPKVYEKFLCLSTAVMLKDHLSKLGYTVILSRSRDVFLELQQRVDFAHSKESTLFVSVHYNTAPSIEAEGIEVYYYDSKDGSAKMKQSKKLAQSVLSSVVSSTGAKSRGVRHGNFAVVRDTEIPSILVEGGFLTNKNELVNLKNSTYLNKLAKGISEGVDDYLQKSLIKKKEKV